MKYDWSNVDWTKNNGEITRLLHCSKKLVSRKRKQLNQIPNPWKPSYSPVDWGNVDWTGKKAKQIAKELNRSVDVVYLHKRKLCRKPKYDFANADWSLSDNVIGKLLGCPSGVVSYHRKKLNATLSPVQQLKGQLNAIDDWNKSNAEIAKCLHCCTQIVSRTRKRLNKPPAPPSRNAIAWHKTHPEVAAQWHPTRNGNLTPMDVTAFGGTKVWWKCKKGHEFEACVSSRKTPNSCPYCSGQKVCKDNCLETLFPEIAAQWHPTKNGSLTPRDVVAGCSKIIYWKCKRGHEWKVRINSRTCGLSGCPHCGKYILLNGEKYDSLIECHYALQFNQSGIDFIHNVKYPSFGIKRCDFYLPETNEYIEVTSFSFEHKKIWPEYIKKIELKRQYVENVLKAKFTFIHRYLTKEEILYVKNNLQF